VKGGVEGKGWRVEGERWTALQVPKKIAGGYFEDSRNSKGEGEEQSSVKKQNPLLDFSASKTLFFNTAFCKIVLSIPLKIINWREKVAKQQHLWVWWQDRG
jgi:hypothetical protein